MSLIIPIYVNDVEINRIVLTRISPTDGQPAEGELCTYVLRYYEQRAPYYPAVQKEVQCPYRTGDPLDLIKAAVLALQS